MLPKLSGLSSMIRNLIFDYGGVLIDIDYSKPSRQFAAWGVQDFEKHFTAIQQSTLFDDFDCGRITEADFRSGIRACFKLNATDARIDEAWNSMIIGIRPEKLELLGELNQLQYRCFLLSNTNFIHLKFITQYLLRTYGRFNLDSFFEKVYYSCTIGHRKPETAVFRLVLEENNLHPGETLFIDDSPQHVDAARQLDILSVQYDPATDLKTVLWPFLR